MMEEIKETYLKKLDPPVTVYYEPFGPEEEKFVLLSPNDKMIKYFRDEEELAKYGFTYGI